MSALLPFLKTRPRLQLEGRAVYLRPPLPRDHHAWAALRAESRPFLEPWEPTWPEHDLTRAAFDEDGAAAKPAKRKAAPKAESNVTPLAARKKDDEAEEGEGETAGGGSSGGGVKPGYNPMSFFTKKGV